MYHIMSSERQLEIKISNLRQIHSYLVDAKGIKADSAYLRSNVNAVIC